METKVNEIWKDIPGYEGNYQASTLGRVKSSRFSREIIMTPVTTNKGYIVATLRRPGNVKQIPVHRIVAITFIPNPDLLPQINHINGVKHDNRIINLEWCTCSQNLKHAFANGLKSQNGGKGPSAKLVLNIQTGIYYECIKDAYEASGTKYNYNYFYRLVRQGKTGFIYA